MGDKVDWDVVRPELRKMSKGDILAMLGRAYELISERDVPHVLGKWVPIDKLRAEGARLGPRTLHDKPTGFHRASIEGVFYDAFAVNSKNCDDLSDGTEAWMDEALVFFERATAASSADSHREARSVFELLWDLFDRIDRVEDIIFFGDEHGSWQVPVDYREVFPAYFASLAAMATPEAFGARVVEIIERHDRGQRDKALAEARALTLSPEHREALEKAIAQDDERLARRRR